MVSLVGCNAVRIVIIFYRPRNGECFLGLPLPQLLIDFEALTTDVALPCSVSRDPTRMWSLPAVTVLALHDLPETSRPITP